MKLFDITRTRTIALSSVAAATMAVVGCQEGSQIGPSIVDDGIEIVVDSSMLASGKSVPNANVLSRTISQLLGCVDAPGYGLLSSDVVTQFMPAYSLDTVGVRPEYIDSLKLILQLDLTAYTGDSIAPMGLEVYPLKKGLTTPMYSSFDPAGYYNSAELLGSVVYNATTANQPDSITKQKMIQIEVKLPTSLGRDLYSAYLKDPTNYATPTKFSDKVFKGLYLHNSFGTGRIIRVSRTMMNMYYHRVVTLTESKRDTTIYGTNTYFAVTPEVITNNNISLSLASSLQKRINDGESIIVAPTGTDVELTFPTREIIAKYRKDITNLGVINSLDIVVAAEPIANKYDIAPPPHLLLVLKSKKDEFFSNNKINDDVTSFYAKYDEDTGTYSFTGLRDYLLDMMKKDTLTPEDYTFVLTPVSISTETQQDYYGTGGSSVVTAITPFVSWPAMVKINFAKTKINLIYSKQTINNY